MTLEDAIKSIAAEFVRTNKSFSSYELLQKLRESLNAGALVVDGLPTRDWAGIKTQAVYSRDIRPHLSALLATGGLPGYTTSQGSSPEGKRYTLYQAPAAPATPATPAAPAQAAVLDL